MSSKEAIAWIDDFEVYFKTKEEDILRRGYQVSIHGRVVLNSYIDQHLEEKLNHDEPPGTGTEIRR